MYCATRWTESKPVAERAISIDPFTMAISLNGSMAISIWPHIVTFVEKINLRPKSKRPKCASYVTVSKAVEDATSLQPWLNFMLLYLLRRSLLNS